MKILGIETSCDETAAAVVELTDDGTCVLHSNVVRSSLDLHTAFGGVVPEIAARSHIEAIVPVVDQALHDAFDRESLNNRQIVGHTSGKSGAGLDRSMADDLWEQIDGIAVTYGAGLGGSLLVGVMTARTLAIAKNKPLYGLNHVEGHIYANFITRTAYRASNGSAMQNHDSRSRHSANFSIAGFRRRTARTASSIPLGGNSLSTRARSSGSSSGLSDFQLPSRQPSFPMLGLIVSGGHSQLVLWRNHFDYDLLGQTTDDAVGEAFDKVAKIIGLPYPGGPSIQKKAVDGDPFAYEFPKAKLSAKFDFSFSGLKTAVLRTAQSAIGEDFRFPSHKIADKLNDKQKADIAASFQRIAIETLVDKTVLAAKEFKPKSVVIGGGVAASKELRRQLADRLSSPIEYTDIKLCTDNGAMIAALGCFMAAHDRPAADPYSLEVDPNLSM